MATPPGSTGRRFSESSGRSRASTFLASSTASRTLESPSRVSRRPDQPAALAIVAMASMVPEVPTASCHSWSAISRFSGSSSSRAAKEAARKRSGEIFPSGKNPSVKFTQPMWRLSVCSACRPSPSTTSVEPPPMSMSSRRPREGSTLAAPTKTSRASSTPGITSIGWPSTASARSMNWLAFFARRSVDVPTTRTRASGTACRRSAKSARQSKPRRCAASSMRRSAPSPSASATRSFTLSMMSMRPPT